MSARAALRVGTRGSALALWQTERTQALLAGAGYPTERVEIRTTGDMVQDVPLARIGSVALFTRQIDEAMLAGRIDLAVHSLKDLPTELPPGIAIAAIGVREDPSDALVGRGPLRWSDLPVGATVATSSLRRRAQLLYARSDLRVQDIRGNVDTRLAKLDRNEDWSAILLATAGLLRLGLGGRIGERIDPDVMLPAPGQGALAVTARADHAEAIAAARAAVHDETCALAVSAERAFLRRLEGGCQVPVAALATLESMSGETILRLRGRVISLAGDRMVEGRERAAVREPSDAERLGSVLAERLLGEGADGILSEVRAGSAVVPAVPEP
ncbi:MAG: hydroxymethylbilane synthase [Gemmatimonadales bacterium]|nr:hydroxymethylbilane synthase [Gemmatimonadales bacterium]